MSKRWLPAIPIALVAAGLHACTGDVVVGDPGGTGGEGAGVSTLPFPGTGASTGTGTGATAGTGGVITGTTGTGTGTGTSTGTGTGTGGSTSGAAWAAYCDKRALACGISAGACKAQEGCAHAMLRDAIEGPLIACLTNTCKEELCFSQVNAQYPPTSKGVQFGAACKDHVASCPGAADDICIATWLFADSLLDQLLMCTGMMGCAQVEMCFDLVVAGTIGSCTGWL